MKTPVQASVEALQSQVQTLSQEVAARNEKIFDMGNTIASLEEQLAGSKNKFSEKNQKGLFPI